jgi:alpha-ketoglutaric semialdehyde dehydrogenase
MIIAGSLVRGSGAVIHGFDPSTGEKLEPAYQYGDESHAAAACQAAAAAFATYRSTLAEQRAKFLEGIAHNIQTISDEIIARAVAETGLPTGRITGEVGRHRAAADVRRCTARGQLERRTHRPRPARPNSV